ncbi:Mobile element protein [Alloactinosynnema sp. L-07]|nr:Mobile element protein [Alloactinosynnema sp. L-07]
MAASDRDPRPGKVVCDLAIAVALGGDCLADIATLRTEPGVFGLVASDPTVPRLIDILSRDADTALAAAARGHEPGHGRWPVNTPQTTASTPSTR